MYKSLMMTLCAITLMACGGGGSDTPSIDSVAVGTGPALSVSTDTASTKSLISDTLSAAAIAVSKGTHSSATAAQNQQTKTSVCTTGSASMTYGPTKINGDGGDMTISGSGTATRHNDTGSFSQSLAATFNGYGYSSVALAKKFTTSGDVNYAVDGDVKAGLDAECSTASTTKAESTTNASFAEVLTETLSGSLSISGGFGAAMTFHIVATTDSKAQTISYDGSATVKSNDTTSECAITGTIKINAADATSFDGLIIKC